MTTYYVEAGDTHFCWSTEPTYRCPNADMPRGGDGEIIATPAIVSAAGLLAADPAKLAGLLERPHRRVSQHRARVDGKLTDTCAICGARLERLGFARWIERKPTTEERKSVQGRINERLGFDGMIRQAPTWYSKTKKDAAAWARSRSKEDACA